METAANIALLVPEDPFKLIEELRCSIASKDHTIQLLEEKINYLLHHRFGAKSECFNPDQLSLFPDEEIEIEPVTEIELPARKIKRGGRRIPPSHLNRIQIEHDLSEEEKQCSCGRCMKRIGEETSYQYDVIPATFQAIENIRYKYACPQCDVAPITAPQDPPAPLPRTQASPGILAWVGTEKFVDGLPLNRIASIAEKRFGVPFTSTTLADWMIKGAKRILSPLAVAMEQELMAQDYLHIDETTLQVLNEPGRTAAQKSYIWVRVSGGASSVQVVLMHYSPGRGGVVANELLESFSGYMQTDGYSGYDATANRIDVTQLGCWAHVRRKFDAASKSSADEAAAIAQEGMKWIRDLYRLDNAGKDKPPDERLAYRQQIIKPHLDKMRNWIYKHQARALSYGGLLATAFTYIHNQWRKLIVFVDDPRLCLDNNKAERHVRPIAQGRKAWLFANSVEGAKATATWYSIVESAKANGIEPYWYLRWIFEQMPIYLRDGLDVTNLLPWNIDPDELKRLGCPA